jgi:hypothetical protein
MSLTEFDYLGANLTNNSGVLWQNGSLKFSDVLSDLTDRIQELG